MARAGKPKQATQRTREEPKTTRSALGDSPDDVNSADVIEALEADRGDRSWQWHGARRAPKSAGGNKSSANTPASRPRRTRSTLRPSPPKGRAPR